MRERACVQDALGRGLGIWGERGVAVVGVAAPAATSNRRTQYSITHL